MPDYFNGATFEENGRVRRQAYRGTGDVTTNVNMKHKIPLSALISYVHEHAPGVPFEEIQLNWSTVTWEDAATADEIAAWQQREADKARRTEEWERTMLAKLYAKYGAPVHADGSGE